MSRKRLALMVSEKMDTNKKQERNENVLIRMSAATREYMCFKKDEVELWPVGSAGEDRQNKSLMLTIFQAFQEDLVKIKKEIDKGTIDPDVAKRIGFVTTKTFNRICGGKKKEFDNIWISDDVCDNIIGTDPEFLLIQKDTNIIVSAQNFLSKEGEMGSDGAMAEIRPKPEASMEKLVANMKQIFLSNKNRNGLSEHNWEVACYRKDSNRGYPVGGHIHVGNPKQLLSLQSKERENFYSVLNKILDEYLAVPLSSLDGKVGAIRRDTSKYPYGGYGTYGGKRTDIGRLEHRTLSGMWLIHPSMSLAVLGTAKAIVDETFRLVSENEFQSDYILPKEFHGKNLWADTFGNWDKIPLAVDMRCILPSKDMKQILDTSKED